MGAAGPAKRWVLACTMAWKALVPRARCCCRGADGGQFVIADGLMQEDAPPLGAFGRGVAAGQPDGVMGQPVAGAQAEVGLAGRPRVVGRVASDCRAYRVELDTAQAHQQAVVVGYQAGLVASFPQGAGVAAACVEQGHIVALWRCISATAAPACMGVSSRWTWLSINTPPCSWQPVWCRAWPSRCW